MTDTTDTKTGRDSSENALLLVRDAPAEMLAGLSAPERLLARSVRRELGVGE